MYNYLTFSVNYFYILENPILRFFRLNTFAYLCSNGNIISNFNTYKIQ